MYFYIVDLFCFKKHISKCSLLLCKKKQKTTGLTRILKTTATKLIYMDFFYGIAIALITWLVCKALLKPLYTSHEDMVEKRTPTARFCLENKFAVQLPNLWVLHVMSIQRSGVWKDSLLFSSLQSTVASANPVFMLLP